MKELKIKEAGKKKSKKTDKLDKTIQKTPKEKVKKTKGKLWKKLVSSSNTLSNFFSALGVVPQDPVKLIKTPVKIQPVLTPEEQMIVTLTEKQ